jgi:hypothetical protein
MPYIEPAHVDYRYVLNQLPPPQGLFRLTIDPQGTITEIKILQHMGGVFDAPALKALINWRAKPILGPTRMVTVSLRYGQRLESGPLWIEKGDTFPGNFKEF